MNYTRHYGLLIERARMRITVEGYTEKHHIVPRCLGGSNSPENIVRLTAEEHFVAHQLLVKLNPESDGLLYAVCLMSYSPHGGRINNRQYGWLKKRLATIQSEKFKDRVWTDKQNKQRSDAVKRQWADPEHRANKISKMTGAKWSEASRAARSESMKGRRPEHINNSGRVVPEEVRARISATLKMKLSKLKAERSLNVRSIEGSIS